MCVDMRTDVHRACANGTVGRLVVDDGSNEFNILVIITYLSL